MNRLKLFSALTAVTMVFAIPAIAQSPGEFVVRVPDPGIVVPGLEPNPQAEVEVNADLTRNAMGFDQGDEDRIRGRMDRDQRREIEARCEVVLENPTRFSADAMTICQAALAD